MVTVKLHGIFDLLELQSHLSLNGYHFNIDYKYNCILLFDEELSYLITILEDRNIEYEIL